MNVGQAAKIFPSASTEFLHGQGSGAVQLPSSLLLTASFGTAALFLVEDIEGGYFDKLRAAPISRTAIVLGRLIFVPRDLLTRPMEIAVTTCA